ncbi:MAG: AmmeMemoRadiSam system protein B [Deltaproteobacteria bacterium]|nr:AmmeMemoRadiSam system protein B [Deltaproteobacteria bacterium]MBW1930243.1 AmmeMemoRadiSam system protein B [Deltaproteobacteria bacterium]MBW2024306.1 AmmeMemoRadiSam system protein B [Deltaproteobacteria bacterium]MBW2125331.1 AmmeMemoRadiSam system protein B [Deltaproteobacteria bacterium]RLB13621.1 MAG: AmmeMemoRadiSam system protein B [Deltaproteobacteria bacterium]
METRRSDFAGSWYPGSERECRLAIEALVRESAPCPGNGTMTLGGIVPHAGWFYSGKLACNVIQCLRETGSADTCIIFGRHLHPTSPNYIMKEGKWSTPLGDLEIDSDITSQLISEFTFTIETPWKYEPDNTIELQLPFVRYFFGDIRIVPLGLPPKKDSLQIARRAAEIAKKLGRRAIIVGSTDLTHYGYNYGFLPKGTGQEAVEWVKSENDRRVIDLILQMDASAVIEEALRSQNACCSGAAASAIEACKALDAKKAFEVAYYTSYDVRPDTSFVGYVGIIFTA